MVNLTMLRVLCIICTLFISFTNITAITAHSSFAGDVNNDGDINSIDAAIVLAYAANIAVASESAEPQDLLINGDIDNDGSVNAADAAQMLAQSAASGVSLHNNAILLPTMEQPVPILVAPASTDNVDNYDIVLDNQLFSTEKNWFLFGHVYNSFDCLENVQIGDTVVLWNNGIPTEHRVIANDIGVPSILSNGKTDIVTEDAASMLYSEHGDQQVIRLITCKDTFDCYHRRVVVAVKVQ